MSLASDLIGLQEIDLDIMRLHKGLDEMPQHASLSTTMRKLEEVQNKSRQISAMRSDCELQMQRLVDEDQELLEKSRALEEEIQQSTDFRSIAPRTKELEGIAKRRNKIEFDHGKLIERADKISSVEDQVAEALSKLEAKKTRLEAEISEICEDARNKLDALMISREEILLRLPDDSKESYERLRKSKNGIAVGVLQDDHCSACRVEFPEGKLVKLNSGPEVTACPQCHRILIVEKG